MTKEHVNYGWVIGSGLIGLLLIGAGFACQYALNWQGAPVEALIAVGTAFMLAGALYFLQRGFIVEVREVVSRTAEAVADTRIEERVREVNARLDELGTRMSQMLAMRRERQDEAVQAMQMPTFMTVATALAEANKLGAIYNGRVRVRASWNRDELGLDFTWGTVMGDQRFAQPQHDELKVRAHVYADERGRGERWVIETAWEPSDTVEAVGLRLREQLEKRGRWKSDQTLDWPMALRNLQSSIDLAIRSRRRDGTGWIQGALIERVVDEWAITDAGLEFPGRGVALAEYDFPDRYHGGGAENWPPVCPEDVEAGLWEELIRRGEAYFPIFRGPIVSQPTWIPLTEPPAV